ALPSGARQLQPHVQAPDYLGLALNFIGVVDTEEQGDALVSQLNPGQSIVSLDGAYWRWDGLHIKASASDRHAIQLQQKNRLEELKRDLPDMVAAFNKAYEEAAEAQKTQQDIQQRL